jgi:hypothetical protein
MSHIPVNHPLRPLYRALVALVGLYMLIFGVVALTQTSGDPMFGQDNLPRVLGLTTNPAFAYLNIVAGIVLLASVVIGRNIDYYIDITAGIVLMAVGLLMLGLLRTDLNFLGFTMTNVIVSFLFGIVAFAAGLYGRTGSGELAAAEEAHRAHQV